MFEVIEFKGQLGAINSSIDTSTTDDAVFKVRSTWQNLSCRTVPYVCVTGYRNLVMVVQNLWKMYYMTRM